MKLPDLKDGDRLTLSYEVKDNRLVPVKVEVNGQEIPQPTYRIKMETGRYSLTNSTGG